MQLQNEIVKQNLTVNDLARMSDAFLKSGMFPDIKSAAQAMVKIQAGQEIGIKPFAAMTGIHIIQGRPTIGAGIIASRIKASGKYDYRVLIMDEKSCNIEFFQGSEKIGNSLFTIEDARKAQTKNLDKFPKNMLFARAISNGVKWFCPDVFDGPVYVPEEMDAKTEDTSATVVDVDDEVKEAISKLPNCLSVEELKDFKSILPDYVIKSDAFVKAATERYNEVKPVNT